MTIFFKKLLILPLSILLLFVSLFFSLFVYRRKIYSVHFSYKFFGHSAIEPAIASSFITYNNVKLFSSHTRFSRGDNRFLYDISRALFTDFIIPFYFLHYIYDNSFPFLTLLISRFYSPLFPKRIDREFYYLPYLATNLEFPWRSLVMDKLNNPLALKEDPSDLPILFACRTSHFHSTSSNVSSQDYRNLDSSELVYFLRSVLQADKAISFIIYSSNIVITHLSNLLSTYHDRIEYVDEVDHDVIPLFLRSRLLVNNGNGIGAFAYSLGFPTLYIKHSPYQSWHSSHLNAVAIPPIYSSCTPSFDILNSLELSFSTSSTLPYDFEDIYSSRGVSLLPLTYYPSSIFSESISQACKLNSHFIFNRLSDSFLDRFVNTSSNTFFWNTFYRLAPESVRFWHSKHYLTISSSFLDYCSFNDRFNIKHD